LLLNDKSYSYRLQQKKSEEANSKSPLWNTMMQLSIPDSYQGWKMDLKNFSGLKKTFKISKLQNLGLCFFKFLVKFYTDHI